MQYNLTTAAPESLATNCLIAVVSSDGQIALPKSLDQAMAGQLKRLQKSGDLPGDKGSSLLLPEPTGLKARRLLLLGIGKSEELAQRTLAEAIAAALPRLQQHGCKDAALLVPQAVLDKAGGYPLARALVEAIESQLYRPDRLKSEKEPRKESLRRFNLHCPQADQAAAMRRGLRHAAGIAEGVQLTKELGNLPGNICTPGYLAEEAKRIGKASPKCKVTILEEARMQRLGMGALLSVSRGSRQPAKLIVMEYKGGKAKDKPVVLVGKGLTFDAGGISLKPAAEMDEMKYDMCGGASVLGTLHTAIQLKLPINLVGIVPASENLPDGDANKPGDIVTSMAGLTIEILNTDAEGRLILCDALHYARRYQPEILIDIATLTGACVIALGQHASGLMSQDDALAEELLKAGEASGDRTWRLPLWDDYQVQLKSNFADLANIGGRQAGAVTAGCFLSRFTKGERWAHLDIAGTAWKSGADKGATGRPVPLLSQLLLSRCGLDH